MYHLYVFYYILEVTCSALLLTSWEPITGKTRSKEDQEEQWRRQKWEVTTLAILPQAETAEGTSHDALCFFLLPFCLDSWPLINAWYRLNSLYSFSTRYVSGDSFWFIFVVSGAVLKKMSRLELNQEGWRGCRRGGASLLLLLRPCPRWPTRGL